MTPMLKQVIPCEDDHSLSLVYENGEAEEILVDEKIGLREAGFPVE